jgi:Cutinase
MKFAIVGYSQGAGVMHSSDKRITGDIRKKVVAAVMFGDPSYGATPFFTGIPTMNVCNIGNSKSLPDPVCAEAFYSPCIPLLTFILGLRSQQKGILL